MSIHNASGVLPFMMNTSAQKAVLRGRLARIDSVASKILNRHHYPDAIAELSAESMALTACLANTVNYDGIFTLQASGKGDVKTLFADVTSDGAMRAYVQYDKENFNTATALGSPAALIPLMKTGYLAFTVDQGAQGRYQGIVPIEDPDLNAAAMRYFFQSEQIDTALLVAAKPDGDGGWHSAALMVQKIPEDGGDNDNQSSPPQASDEDDDIWHTACTFMATCGRDELMNPNLPPEELLRRLFQELNVAVLPYRPIRDECQCSPERVVRMLDGMTQEERQEFADDDGMVSVVCEFCKNAHRSPV